MSSDGSLTERKRNKSKGEGKRAASKDVVLSLLKTMEDIKCPCTFDCPDRNGYECKLTCKKLKEYEEIHFKFLQEKLKEKNTKMEYISYKKRTIAKSKRRK